MYVILAVGPACLGVVGAVASVRSYLILIRITELSADTVHAGVLKSASCDPDWLGRGMESYSMVIERISLPSFLFIIE